MGNNTFTGGGMGMTAPGFSNPNMTMRFVAFPQQSFEQTVGQASNANPFLNAFLMVSPLLAGNNNPQVDYSDMPDPQGVEYIGDKPMLRTSGFGEQMDFLEGQYIEDPTSGEKLNKAVQYIGGGAAYGGLPGAVVGAGALAIDHLVGGAKQRRANRAIDARMKEIEEQRGRAVDQFNTTAVGYYGNQLAQQQTQALQQRRREVAMNMFNIPSMGYSLV